MRVLILPSWYPDKDKPLNGIFFKEQAEALKSAGIDVIVLNINLQRLFSKINKGLTVKVENNIKVYRYKNYNYFPKLYKLYIKYYGYLINKLIKKIEKENGKIDLVHVHSAFDAGIAYGNLNIDIPYVITEHSTRYDRNLINSSEKDLLSKAFYNAKKSIAVGRGLKESIEKFTGYKDSVIVPNMVKNELIEVKEDLNKNKFRFFSLGFLKTHKCIHILIEAFERNREAFKDVELFIGGDGPEFNNLKDLISKYNLENQIFLLGLLNREEVSYHMKNCDAFVLPSKIETFGVVYIEAMIEGKPVISAKNGGPDTFITDKVGMSVNSEDVEGLAKAMNEMYINYEKYDPNYIKKYCEENFSSKVVTEKIIEIYKEVIGKENGY